jgi:hypothetical protein
LPIRPNSIVVVILTIIAFGLVYVLSNVPTNIAGTFGWFLIVIGLATVLLSKYISRQILSGRNWIGPDFAGFWTGLGESNIRTMFVIIGVMILLVGAYLLLRGGATAKNL